MKCTDCPYYWADSEEYVGEDGETHLRVVGNEYCHYRWNDGYAPCEQEDDHSIDEETHYYEEDE